MADCGHALCLPFDACRFVVRTQAERHTDGTTWRPSLGVNPDDPELACTAWRYPDPPPIPDHALAAASRAYGRPGAALLLALAAVFIAQGIVPLIRRRRHR